MGQNLSAGPGDYTVENPVHPTTGTPRESEHPAHPPSTSVTQVADTQQHWFVIVKDRILGYRVMLFENEVLARENFLQYIQAPAFRDNDFFIGPIVGYKLAEAR
jgi:hypothetical protein